ncbi:hypothetical protein EST38_g5442 [Candolleomyces aberdarensis]|uniref:DJ-1/PfpI domain-containing protein n=1 Tax=Candolleomyces aberdarensis TaxID=2316362 RepID=A0A4V1Q406_9AGAR|nr:hypothetical protein EST38_g5442 [Candolleomyces aberdarensis]
MLFSPKNITFGVLLIPGYQWLDAVGPVDYINSHSHAMMQMPAATESLRAKAPIINWHYISSEGNFNPISASAGPPHIPTVNFTSCPPLDYLLIPGPALSARLYEECSSFIHERFSTLKGLLTVCTGSIYFAQSGLLDGVHVASNKVALKYLVETGRLNRKVKWVGDKRFVRDGKIWSSAGITSGLDLAAEFARVHFDPELVDFARNLTEYDSNPAQPDPFAPILDGVDLD